MILKELMEKIEKEGYTQEQITQAITQAITEYYKNKDLRCWEFLDWNGEWTKANGYFDDEQDFLKYRYKLIELDYNFGQFKYYISETTNLHKKVLWRKIE